MSNSEQHFRFICLSVLFGYEITVILLIIVLVDGETTQVSNERIGAYKFNEWLDICKNKI